jgi:hypothetical protein
MMLFLLKRRDVVSALEYPRDLSYLFVKIINCQRDTRRAHALRGPKGASASGG